MRLQHQIYSHTRRGYSHLITHFLAQFILPEKLLSGHKQGVIWKEVSRLPPLLISAEVCLFSSELGWFGSKFRTKFLFPRLPGVGSPRQAQELHCVQDLPTIGVTNYDEFNHSHLVLWACSQRFILILVFDIPMSIPFFRDLLTISAPTRFREQRPHEVNLWQPHQI